MQDKLIKMAFVLNGYMRWCLAK